MAPPSIRHGYYWCAMVGAGLIARFDPTGRMDRSINLPVRDPTMCAFGGQKLDTLYVTTARRLLQPPELAAQPLAGGVFVIEDVGVHGLPEPLFAG